MFARSVLVLSAAAGLFALLSAQPPAKEKLYDGKINLDIKHIATDKDVKYDFDIVYVRAQRAGDDLHKRFYTDIATPVTLEPGADLMLLHPDGKEELLMAGGDGAITDPVISFDGDWVYYTHIYTLKGANAGQPPTKGADIFKMHLKTRKLVKLTNQEFTPNTGAADWSAEIHQNDGNRTYLSYGVLNFGAYPLPGGKLVFTSNRNAFRPPNGYPRVALQLFVMDDPKVDPAAGPKQEIVEPTNLEQIGFLNIAGALHPVTLTDGRIIFSSLESQGIRDSILWGIWEINPDGTGWGPVVSAFDPTSAPNAYHFQSQLSDGSLVIEGYYNQNNSGFGTFVKLPAQRPYPAFGPAYMQHERHKPWRFGRHDNGKAKWYRMPFLPAGSEVITPFAPIDDAPADTSVLGDKTSPRVGKVTHPAGAPDNHLLCVYSPGPANHQYKHIPQIDGGIYLIKKGAPIEEPGQLLLIKNDPKYNESWPRAVVPYKRIYGIDEPKILPALLNDGKKSPELPEGTPFGLVGTSSMYKRESFPNGAVPQGKVTAEYAGGNNRWKGIDAFTSHGNGVPLNWHNQGGDAGLYTNDDIHAIRILAMEPTTDRNRGGRSGRLFFSHAMERLRILGEIPVRKFGEPGVSATGGQPLDPDGNPDTSFLAKLPADTAFTFQTIDRRGMVLNMAQTWHQLRPGEVRHDCGGCHAHSQQPTPFEKTAAAKPGYKVWDLINETPLVTAKAADKSQKKWDANNETGLRLEEAGVVNVEYFRDVRPILERSCVACHTSKEGKKPAGNLDLDADAEQVQAEHHGKFPGTYFRLCLDNHGQFGHKPTGWESWGYPQASRYIRKLQSRRSLLTWKIYGERLDGFSNDDHPSESEPGKGDLALKGQPVEIQKNRHHYDVDFVGSVMPPPAAVNEGKVKPLSDEDRRTLVRWIDLGCPLDLDFDPKQPARRGYGWMCDDNRPIVALTTPQAGTNGKLTRILLGLHDYYSGLDMDTLSVTADFPINGLAPGMELRSEFKAKSQGVLELKLEKPIARLDRGQLTVSIKDKQGNINRIVRTFSVK